jgi:hypothetical protein
MSFGVWALLAIVGLALVTSCIALVARGRRARGGGPLAYVAVLKEIVEEARLRLPNSPPGSAAKGALESTADNAPDSGPR